MTESSDKNNSACNHEVLPSIVLKGHFAYPLSEKYKKKLNLWSKVINLPKEGRSIDYVSKEDAVSSQMLKTGTYWPYRAPLGCNLH